MTGDDLLDCFSNFLEEFETVFDQFQEFMRQQRQMPYIPKEAKRTMKIRPEKPRIYFNKQERPRTRSNL
jgi:hypothetical protein